MASEHAKTMTAPERAPETGAGTPGLEGDVQRTIGRQLRAMYDDILYQPVPDQFLMLLQELEKRESAIAGDGGEEG